VHHLPFVRDTRTTLTVCERDTTEAYCPCDAYAEQASLDFHSAGKQLTLRVDDGLGLGKLDDEFLAGEPMHRSRRVRQSRRDKVRIVSAFVE